MTESEPQTTPAPIDAAILEQNEQFALAIDDALANGESYLQITFQEPHILKFKHIESKHIKNTEVSGLILEGTI